MKYILTFSAAFAALAPASHAGVTMAPMTSFGGGDGWRAPGEIVAGDAAGTSTGTTYNYLGTGSFERGFAYSPVLDRILLVSRAGGINIRQLDPLTGADLGSVATGGITGGTFALSQIACANDGTVYGANLATAGQSFKVYKWDDVGSNPVTYFDTVVPGFSAAPRLGDSFDMIDTGSGHYLVAGCAGVVGYLVIPGANTGISVATFSGPTPPVAQDFRPGVTFGPNGASEVWGKAHNGNFRRTTYSGTAGTSQGTATLVAGSAEGPMDTITMSGLPLLATVDINSGGGTGRPTVRVYDVTNPAAPALVASGTTATGTMTANSNTSGTIKWGAVSGNTIKLYAMTTNQGLQAFTVTVTSDVIPPTIGSSPGNRSVLDRGQTTFTVSATGTPPFSYQWYKDTVLIDGAVGASHTVNPVGSGSAGSYVCRVTNSGGFADSTAAVLTVVPSVNTAALTETWRLPPGSRPWITSSGDTERGVDYNPVNNRVYLASRNPSPQVYVIDGTTTADLGQLNMTGVSGGTFAIMFPRVATDGSIYVCNLSSTADGSGFKIYHWADDNPATVATTDYNGNPVGSRIGDDFDLRGGGATLECIAGARNTNEFALFRLDGSGALFSTTITVSGVSGGAFGLGIAFGEGNTVWGKNGGGQLLHCSYDPDTGTGALIASYGTAAGVATTTNPLDVDTVNHCIAMVDIGNSDNVRLYQYSADSPPVLTLLDQEFLFTDNTNGNGVGSVYAGNGRVIALDTNNGLVSYSTLKPAPPVLGAISHNAAATSLSMEITGTPGFNYVVEGSNDLSAASWAAVATVPFTTATETVILPMSASRNFFRTRLGP